MFKRLIYDEWTTIVPIISFCLTFGVFALTAIRAMMMPKDRREALAAIPLRETENIPHSHV